MSIIYKSLRVGKYRKLFYLYKFRSMVNNADKLGGPSTAGDDLRLTEFGKFLRKYKIDELPQLWNVIKRDINLVGPRPEVPEVVDLMTEKEKEIIFSVRPGLTDLATLWNFHEEDNLAGQADPHQYYLDHIWPEKKRLQIEYVKNKSLKLDIWILCRTIKGLLKTLVKRS